MKKAVLLALVVAVAGALAQGSGTGLGVIVGEPTGVSAKFWLGGNMAFDAAAAWSVYRYTALHIHADVLYHNFDLLKVSPGALPAYVGVGGRVKLAGRVEDEKDVRIGVRVPFGLEYLFEPVPVGLFLEVAPILDLVPGTGFGINGALGARWYFR
ncbi:MAG: hypothetical protein R6X12_02610 [bacterium]